MVLRMKNFNILEVHWKIWVLRRGLTKNQYREGDCLKSGGAWTVCRFKGEGLARKRGWCFWGGVDTPMHTMYIVSENEKMGFWYDCFPNILWTVLVASIPNLQLMSNVWRKLKVDCHTTTKALSHFEHFSPFSKDSKIPGTEPKHVKTSFLKACLEICMENIQCEELKDQLTHRRS